MPFYLAKRTELPEPKRGQMEYDLFTDLYGREWNSDATILFDDEKKITEFDFENFLPPALLN